MVSQACVGGARRQHSDVLRERVRGGLTAVWQRCGNHLIDVHAVVTRQRASRRQVVGSQESGDDSVPVHLSYCGAIHEINQAALVHGNACWQEGRERVGRGRGRNMVDTQLAWLSGQNTEYMCRAWLPIIQVTAKSTAVNYSWAAFLLFNNFWSKSRKGCIHEVYVHSPHLVTPLPSSPIEHLGRWDRHRVASSSDFRHPQ